MKQIRHLLVVIALVASFSTAHAQLFRYGIRAGITTNSLDISGSDFSSHNRTGFNIGIATEFNLPLIPFSIEASAIYMHRKYNVSYTEQHVIYDDYESQNFSISRSSNYIGIPVHAKWNISIPAVSYIVKPCLFTGPAFNFLVGKRNAEIFKRSNCDIDWDFGFGAEFAGHLQLSAYYSLGLNKAATGYDESGKTRGWTISAAYMF